MRLSPLFIGPLGKSPVIDLSFTETSGLFVGNSGIIAERLSAFTSLATLAGVQGYSTDGTYHYNVHTTELYKYDSGFTQVASNTSPFTNLPAGINHLGDAKEYNGKLYVSADNWQGCASPPTNNVIAVFNTSDLSYDSHIVLPDYVSISGVTVHGGELLVTSFCESVIHRFDFTGTHLGDITPNFKIHEAQGLDSDGTHLWVSASYGKIFRVDPTNGNIVSVYITDNTGESEGIDVSNGLTQLYATGNLRKLSSLPAVSSPTRVAGQFDASPKYAIMMYHKAASEGTFAMRVIPNEFFNYNSLLDSEEGVNAWESWIYSDGRLAFRQVNSVITSALPDPTAEFDIVYVWRADGTAEIYVDGTLAAFGNDARSFDRDVLHLGAGNSSNTPSKATFKKFEVYTQAFTASEAQAWTGGQAVTQSDASSDTALEAVSSAISAEVPAKASVDSTLHDTAGTVTSAGVASSTATVSSQLEQAASQVEAAVPEYALVDSQLQDSQAQVTAEAQASIAVASALASVASTVTVGASVSAQVDSQLQDSQAQVTAEAQASVSAFAQLQDTVSIVDVVSQVAIETASQLDSTQSQVSLSSGAGAIVVSAQLNDSSSTVLASVESSAAAEEQLQSITSDISIAVDEFVSITANLPDIQSVVDVTAQQGAIASSQLEAISASISLSSEHSVSVSVSLESTASSVVAGAQAAAAAVSVLDQMQSQVEVLAAPGVASSSQLDSVSGVFSASVPGAAAASSQLQDITGAVTVASVPIGNASITAVLADVGASLYAESEVSVSVVSQLPGAMGVVSTGASAESGYTNKKYIKVVGGNRPGEVLYKELTDGNVLLSNEVIVVVDSGNSIVVD